jgi:fructose-1,6-bisphosphatase I
MSTSRLSVGLVTLLCAFHGGEAFSPLRAARQARAVHDRRRTACFMTATAPSETDRAAPTAPIFNDVCKETGITLSRFMIETALANPELAELESIFSSIETASKTISNLVRRSSLTGLTGYLESGNINVQGEEQKKLDVITNDVLKNALRYTGRMGVLASEEEDEPVEVEDELQARYGGKAVLVEQTTGKYVAVFDPLDGSSNVDAGIPTGTIFGIFEDKNEQCEIGEDGEISKDCLTSTLQPGTNLVAAGYVLYSSATHLFFTLGAGTHGFTYDEHIGEFVLSHPDVKIPSRGKIYSINEANRWEWDAPLQKYITNLQKGEGESGNKYTSRYIGSMVGDVHRTLLYGGVFGYPADAKNKNGKLRLLYEAAPMAFLVEQAGGIATTGRTRIMEVSPTNVHQRLPVMLGSADDVSELQELYKETEQSTDIWQI